METSNIRLQIDSNSFDNLFEEKLGSTPTNSQAYEAAESEHEKLTGHRKYSGYDSYRVSRTMRRQRRKK